jgi:hypothetical protein
VALWRRPGGDLAGPLEARTGLAGVAPSGAASLAGCGRRGRSPYSTMAPLPGQISSVGLLPIPGTLLGRSPLG